MCMYQKKVLSELKTKHIQIFPSISIKTTTKKLAVSQVKAMITQHISMVWPSTLNMYTVIPYSQSHPGIHVHMYVNSGN